MAPVTKPQHERYDIVFIGGGSGGVSGSVSPALLLTTLTLLLLIACGIASCSVVWEEGCVGRVDGYDGRDVR